MKPIQYILLALVIIILLLVFLFWDKIISFFNKAKDGDKCIISLEPAYIEGIMQNGKCVLPYLEGRPCMTSDNRPGMMVNHQCIPNVFTPPANPPIVPPAQPVNNLEVSNPNGAPVYYQWFQNGGAHYSQSNLTLPVGTKLTLVKEWKDPSTNLNKIFYETTYKFQAQTGFFRSEDIKKI